MAEAVARKLLSSAGIRAEVFSAGVEPEKSTPSGVIEVLKEKGYPVRGLYPKSLKKIPYRSLDVVVILDAEAKERCEFVIAHKRREHIHIDEPVRHTPTEYREILERIERELRELFGFEKERRVSK